ncbi:hypothetical protein ACIAD0525 [Acinetobacter baylyi ADP1]|uniref:Uncharacterized protein n=1 Tax=Acinetobacter baylyi (strain ATCC 33305 / BD413 / ADP1) TaxID=62977 RepID=Q6FEQ7_ACIAD|nr:hypothetical protein ACIAD0525 [Acinetobacter baylyi ADP1]
MRNDVSHLAKVGKTIVVRKTRYLALHNNISQKQYIADSGLSRTVANDVFAYLILFNLFTL